MTLAGVPNLSVLDLDDYPTQGLGFYQEAETTGQFSSRKWSSWTRKEVQPMQVDQEPLNMLKFYASASASAQPSIANQDVKIPDSGDKGSKQPNSQSDAGLDAPMKGASKAPLSDKRERLRISLVNQIVRH